jgi:hypothetical protein
MHCNTAAFEDFTGLPIIVDEKINGEVHKVARFAKAHFVPGAVWKEKEFTVGALDEIPSAPPNVQCILREIIDGQLNGDPLDPKCLYVGTGNPPEARFTTGQAIDEAVEDRLDPYVVVPAADELLQIWSRIMHDTIYQFLLEHQQNFLNAISPRRWMTVSEKVQNLVEANENPDTIVQDVQSIFVDSQNVLPPLRKFLKHGNNPELLPVLGRTLISAGKDELAVLMERIARWLKEDKSGLVGESKNDLLRVLATLTPEDRTNTKQIAHNVMRFMEALVKGKRNDMAKNIIEACYSRTELVNDITMALDKSEAVEAMTDAYQKFKKQRKVVKEREKARGAAPKRR